MLVARPARFPWALFLPILTLLTAGPAPSQQATPSPPPPTASPQKQDPSPKPDVARDQKPVTTPDSKPLTPEEERQAQIVADTKKLYELAEELQAEVAKSNKNTLSLAVVKKAAEVEKLAKSLKERMRPE